ncbi:hypothetical protein CBR_g20194 [Chara braunii]|uniref:Uncharacterized protein n=1 Tax=Chara braunii TaxID=69332 RepID=A0A388L036_CHABU|nr:hypothetical protein CBR_g20194 [Chara braunii]|eukprot:GBG75563.1 hypothetical protein CBR_g20194 [Chara braunii]
MPDCGAVVFLSDDNGLSWYCCGGVEKSEAGRFTYDGRKFRTYFLTSVYDREGINWVKEDKKVSLDHRLFQGYGVKALLMKAFDVRENGTEFQMLDPEKFLFKTNGYRVTGSLPVLDSAFMLSRPSVQFNSPTDQLAAFVMRYREEFARLPAAQQVDRVFVPIDAPSSSAAGPKQGQDQPAKAGGKRTQLATAPSSSAAVVQALPAPVLPSDQKGRVAAEQSSEATDYDDGAVRYRAGPGIIPGEVRGAFDDDECEGQDGEGGGWRGEGGGEEGEGGGEEGEGGVEGNDGNEGDAEGEDDGMDEERDDVGEEVQDNRSSQFHRRHQNESQGRREDDACHVGDAIDASGQPASSRGMSQSYDQTKDGGDEPGSRENRKRGETSTSPASRTKQARADAVNEARGALTASQEARAPRKTGGGDRSGNRGGGRAGGRKGSQRSRAPELRDSGDEGEGVGPRMPEDIEELVQHAALVDTTRCFFLEYDEQGFARQDVQVVNVDVNRIKPIPRRKILFNHCSLSVNIVRGIESVIESSISADPRVWDRPELVLAPVDPNVTVGGQGRRITPDEFFQRDSGKLPIGDGKIPLEMPGRMEGRLPGPYTDENKGQRTLYHCIYARDGPKGSTVSWKDLCPTYFKNFWDMTCREREVALLLLMSGKVVATKVRVTPPRVNKVCLLDIMRKERYMVRIFNYVVFRAEGRTGDEWNDDFFMSYKDLEERYASNVLCADEWEKQREKLHSNLVKTIPRRLGGVEEVRQGAGLGPTQVMYKEAPFYFKVFIYTTIDKLDMLRAEVKRIASSARHLVWDKLQRQTTLLPVCMPSKEVMAAPVDIVAAAQKITCRAAIVDISAANFSSAWTSQDFDALYAMMAKCCGPNWVLFFFAPQNVQSDVLRQLYRWEDIELIPGSWKRVDRPPSDVTRYGNIATSSRDLMAIVLHAEGGDLKKVTLSHPVFTTISLKCMLWRKNSGSVSENTVASKATKVPHIQFGSENLASNNVIACDESAKDIAYLTQFVDILVKDGRFECRIEKPRATHRTNMDMYHKLGPKRQKVWEYLFRDAPDGRLDGGYIYRKAKVTEALKHYHGALTGAFETFVARCEILRFDLHKDKLTFKDYADLAKSGEGFNPVDSEEDSSDSDLEIEKDTNATGWCGKSADMEQSVKRYGPGQTEGCSNLPPANSVASGVDRVVCTPMEDDEDDDLDIPAQPTKLVPGDSIPPRFCADPNNVYFLDDKYTCTSKDKWGHDIIWHDDIFEPCIQGREWKMAVKYVSKGWRPFARMGKDNWLKTTKQSILYRCRKENPGESKTSIAAKAKQLFDALGATRQLEYSHKFYELQSSPSYGKIDWKVERAAALDSMDVDSRKKCRPCARAGHREHDG